MGSPPRRAITLDLLSALALLGGVALLCLAALSWVSYQSFLLSLLQR